MEMTENIQRTLGRIEEKVDTLISYRFHHEKRINSLEHSRTRVLAYVTVGSAILSAAGSAAASYIGKLF